MDSLTVPVVLLILGGVCVLAALFGGVTGTISLPTLNKVGRAVAAILGAILLIGGVGLSIWVETSKRPANSTHPSTPLTTTTSAELTTSSPADTLQPIAIDEVSAPPLCATFTGTGDIPDGSTLWLGVLSDEPKYYYFPVMADTEAHKWTAQNVTLGEPSEKEGEPFQILAILADDAANNAIEEGKFANGARSLSRGMEVADKISVRRGPHTAACVG